jgi:molecular chaperone Hsp33
MLSRGRSSVNLPPGRRAACLVEADVRGMLALVSDLLIRAIDRDAGLRVIAAVTTDLAREAAGRHGAQGIGACALGRALTSSLLLATLTKGGERVTLQIEGDGPIGGITADANDEGDVRGYLHHVDAARQHCEGRCRVVEALGRSGVVNVVRDFGLKERYQGQVSLITGEIDEDVEGYLRVSEQVPSALGCDVLLDGERVVSAAGVLVQALPGGDFDTVRPAQHVLRTGAIFEFLRRGGGSARELAEAVYGLPVEVIGEQALRYRCRCSVERVEGMLGMLSTVDIDEMIADPGHAQVTCNFCNTVYVVDGRTLERIRAHLARGPRVNN